MLITVLIVKIHLLKNQSTHFLTIIIFFSFIKRMKSLGSSFSFLTSVISDHSQHLVSNAQLSSNVNYHFKPLGKLLISIILSPSEAPY